MAVTVNKDLVRAEECRVGVPVAASTNLYEATLAFINSSGYAVGIVASGANRFAGVVIQQQDNSSGANGALTAELYTEGVFPMYGSGFSQATVNADIYATDNYTVQASPVGGSFVGRCVKYVSSTCIMVRLVANGATMEDCQTVTAAADSGTGSSILAGVTKVNVTGVTTNADDWVVLPAIASVPIGHQIFIACNAGANFELRTPASSNTKINDVDADGSQEYLCTDTDVVVLRKRTTTGWVAQSLTKLGAVRTAVVPD